MKNIKIPLLNRAKGFTLIEFLVASALAVIVISAAGGTYFITRRLNQAAVQRLDIQQNLRTAALQITRDARLAGTFGCYSTGNDNTIVPDITPPDFTRISANPDLKLDNSAPSGFGVKYGTVHSLPALIFVYGQGEMGITNIDTLSTAAANPITSLTLSNSTQAGKDDIDSLRQTAAAGGPVVLSSCRHAFAIPAPSLNGNVITTNVGDNTNFGVQDGGEMAVSKLYASAYVFNQAERSLFRVDVDNAGQWQSPQLLATGVNRMDVGFGYTDNCPTGFSNASGAVDETFTFSNSVSQAKLPSLVQVRLNYDLDTTGATPTTADYIINATVRGGNTCGNRMPI